MESGQATSKLKDVLAKHRVHFVLELSISEIVAELQMKHGLGDTAEKALREVLQLVASKDVDADK